MRVPRMWGVDRDHRASLGRQGVHGETDREPRGGVMGVVSGGDGVAARRRRAPGGAGGGGMPRERVRAGTAFRVEKRDVVQPSTHGGVALHHLNNLRRPCQP